jgi:hypothetical protein
LRCHRTGGDSVTGACRGEADSLCPAGTGGHNVSCRNAGYVIAVEMTFESDVFMLGVVIVGALSQGRYRSGVAVNGDGGIFVLGSFGPRSAGAVRAAGGCNGPAALAGRGAGRSAGGGGS